MSVTNDSGRDADGTLNIVGRIDGQRVDDQLMGVRSRAQWSMRGRGLAVSFQIDL
ncbi:MAG: hypothetical protein R2710_25905 [Acidimicrobiales bacterium]